MAVQLTCPHCQRGLAFDRGVPPGSKIRCRGCGEIFVAASNAVRRGDPVPVAKPYSPPPVAAPYSAERAVPSPPRVGRRPVLAVGIILGGVAVFLAAAVALTQP